MKKTIVVEYVGIEDVQLILDDCLALMKDGHFASVDLHNAGGEPLCSVSIMLGGFDKNKEFDYKFLFYLSDKPSDVYTMNECKSVIKNLLVEG